MIDLQNIDDELMAHYQAAIRAMPEALLITAAKEMPELMRGLNQSKPNMEQLRQRVLGKMQLKKLPPTLLEILRTATLAESLIVALSDKAILQSLPALFEQFGRVSILASMWLDDRQSIQDGAKAELANPTQHNTKHSTQSKPKSSSKSKPDSTFNQRFKPLLDVLRPALEGMSFVQPKTLAAAPPTQPPALSPAHVENQIRANSIYKQVLRERNEFKTSLDQVTVVRDQFSNALQKMTALADALAVRLAAAETDQQRRIAQGIADGLNKRIAPWLPATEKLANENLVLKTARAQSPIERASQLLDQQAKLDKRFGTRSAKNQELATALRLQAELKIAQEESLRPLPQLADEILALSNHMADIDKLLSDTSIKPQSPQLQRLQQELLTLLDLEALQEKKKTVELSMAMQAWPVAQCKQAFELFDKQSISIYDRNHCESSSLKDLPPPSTPKQQFVHCLTHASACRLMIDGHNLLFMLKPLIGVEYFTNGRVPNAKARALLTEQVKQLTQHHPLLEADVWFDSPDDQHWSETDQLRVWFSGGIGTDRADRRILEALQAFAYKGAAASCFVVTQDQDLLDKAKSLNAIVVSPLEMWAMLN